LFQSWPPVQPRRRPTVSSCRPDPRRGAPQVKRRQRRTRSRRENSTRSSSPLTTVGPHARQTRATAAKVSSCRALLVPSLRSRLSSMIQGSAAPLLPPSPALAVATGGPPAHEDTGSAPRPEETTPRSPSSPTMRASSQLNRWSRARALRSGHRISPSVPVTNPPPLAEEGRIPAAPGEGGEEEDGGVCPAERDAALGKAIYMVSDGTGWTAEHSVSAALGQFEHCLADRRCVVSTHLFSGVNISRRPLCRFVWSS
jgi:hypothetical protein